MAKRFVAWMVLAASVLLLPIHQAVAEDFGLLCAEGPIMTVTNAVAWGPESTCRCSGIRGGALGGSNGFAWLWSEGTGAVALFLEWRNTRNGVLSWAVPLTFDNKSWVSRNGSGLAEAIQGIPYFQWTGRYRAVCYRPR